MLHKGWKVDEAQLGLNLWLGHCLDQKALLLPQERGKMSFAVSKRLDWRPQGSHLSDVSVISPILQFRVGTKLGAHKGICSTECSSGHARDFYLVLENPHI